MTKSCFDTNILFYSFDSADATKQAASLRVVQWCFRTRTPVPLQMLAEFYQSVTRKVLAPALAASIVADLQRDFLVVAADQYDLTSAIALQQQYRLQLFDCLILATVARAGCRVLFSEDMQHLAHYGSVQVINPFLLSQAELDTLLA